MLFFFVLSKWYGQLPKERSAPCPTSKGRVHNPQKVEKAVSPA